MKPLRDTLPDNRPSLLDRETVEAIVRSFGKFVFDTRAAWHLGEPGAENPIASIEQRARHLGDVFTGRSPEFAPDAWHTPAKIGNYMRVLLPQDTKDFGDPVTGFFMWFASQLLLAAQDFENGTAHEEEVHRHLEPIIEDVIARLLHTKH
jgi:hypothetical protein